MDIRALRYFVELVREKSFTRASEKLFVTQPTISKMIRNIEEELGQPLLNREGRRFTLTDSGGAVQPGPDHLGGDATAGGRTGGSAEPATWSPHPRHSPWWVTSMRT